ncbi:MAG TPA: hypothetical protein VK419_14260 [Bryobacteraceae bacterium]|nr:hypothetical protein [Bryobacteraceae bacterium]
MRSAGIALVAALCLFAQPSRDAYRTTYKAWRETDPNLEREAAAAGAQLEPRAHKVAAAAAQYEAARNAFLEQLTGESKTRFAWLEAAAPDPPVPLTEGARALVIGEWRTVQRSVDTFSSDVDPGIQRLRGMLQRESLALAAVNTAITEREKAASAVTAAAQSLERTRARALEDYRDLAAGWTESAAETDRESAAWVEYYQLLADGAKSSGPPASTPTPPASVSSALPASAAGAGTAAPSPRSAEPGVPRSPSPTAVPLVRYTGAWTFPISNGLYHGPQPEFADLVVHEDNGHASGTLFARFKLAPGATGDPVLRFDFSGDFTSQRTQVFNLETSDGAKGTMELIPGPAFNLLEVNFQIAARPDKVRQGNMVLVKK